MKKDFLEIKGQITVALAPRRRGCPVGQDLNKVTLFVAAYFDFWVILLVLFDLLFYPIKEDLTGAQKRKLSNPKKLALLSKSNPRAETSYPSPLKKIPY